MSSSIAIPPRRTQPHHHPTNTTTTTTGSSPASAASSSFASVMSNSMSPPRTPMSSSAKGKQKAVEYGFSSSPLSMASVRRPSLMGSSISKSEFTVVNLGHEDGPPRLVTCVKSSQGFDWNQELFLPSYVDYDSSDLEHRPDPIEDIHLTDEEIANMMPR